MKTWEQFLVEMGGTDVVAGDKTIPQGTYNVLGAKPNGEAYPSTSMDGKIPGTKGDKKKRKK
jgi:hypothetical protein